MADVISRLRLESGEFDSKIKRAGQELLAYSEHCKKMGLEMGYANKDAKDFAKALGSMQTTSSSARGKINELTEAFVNLKVMYKNMTDEEKNNTFGKNLAASLDQLKTRIDQAKAELNDVNKELGNTKQAEADTKGALEGLTSALGINIKTLAGWGTAIAAGKVALDVAKDAFFASESSVDEWGRTVAASQSLYEGFLTAINNGDISGYLNNIDSIVNAARLAYDELDKLGTMKTIQAPKMSAQQTENERLRMMIQTGRYIAPIDGRKASMKDGQLLTPAQIKTLERQLQNGMQNVVKLVGNEVKQTGKAIDAYYNSIAKQNGMSLQEFKKGTSSWEEFSKKMQGYDDYKKWDKQARTEFAKQGGRGNVDFDKSNPFAEFRKWGTFRVDKMGDNSYNDLVRLIQQRDQQAGQAYGMQSQAYRTMNRAEGVTVRQLMGGGGHGGGGGKTTTINSIKDDFTDMEELVGLIPVAEQKVKDLQQQIRESWDEGEIEKLREDLKLAQAELDRLNGKAQKIDLNKMFPERGVSDGASQSFGEQMAQSIRLNLAQSIQDADAQTLRTLLEAQIKNGIEGIEIPADSIIDQIFGEGADIPDEYWQNLQDQINEKLKEMEIDPINIDFSTGKAKDDKGNSDKEFKEFNAKAGQFISGLANVSNGLKNLGLQLPEGVDQLIGTISSVMQVIQGVNTVISVFSASAMSANTAAIIANTAALYANSVLSVFSNGGIAHAANGWSGTVPGTSYSGDNIPIMVNSGELILNRAQQGNIASQLEGGGLGDLQLELRVDAEELIIMLNNNGKRRGLGRLING